MKRAANSQLGCKVSSCSVMQHLSAGFVAVALCQAAATACMQGQARAGVWRCSAERSCSQRRLIGKPTKRHWVGLWDRSGSGGVRLTSVPPWPQHLPHALSQAAAPGQHYSVACEERLSALQTVRQDVDCRAVMDMAACFKMGYSTHELHLGAL